MSIKTNTIAFEVAAEIYQATGFNPLVSGGCARDFYYGVEPKDYDIIVTKDIPYTPLEEVLMKLSDTGGISMLPIYTESARDRIEQVIKLKHKGVDFDILIYNIQSVFYAPDYFDFNLNQFVLADPDTALFVGEVHPKDALVPIRGDHSTKRYEYVKAKWESLNGRNG